MSEPRQDRPFDVVVYGASGFVGRLVAEYLAQHAAGVRVALAGRSAARLEEVRAELGPAAEGWEILTADAEDDAALAALARSTRVVATTVGPYTRHGLPLVRACAEAGTHYADLAGEVFFIRDSAARFDDVARRTGARIVHACGFDSVPSDLGVLLTAERARADAAGELRETTLTVRALGGGISGGTVDSVRVQVDAARDPENRRTLADPYALSPDRDAEPDLDQHVPGRAFRDATTGEWVAPFPMGSFNAQVVHRSNSLQGWAYGRTFRYREVVDCGRGKRGERRARALAAGTEAGILALALPPTRWVADRLLPSPGEGPDAQTRHAGFFRLEVLARTTAGARYRTTVAAQGDPGYEATAVMLGEAVLALASDGDRLPGGGGVRTPATAVGMVLADRLVRAGFEITTDRVGEPAP
ncbi:saccharopine dehydrogenase family protein [Georgenia faecalis]|uniref:Saccharopine dehydrogenase family protein n=1 Tax=Georgenia faecalis TaxID=2483799 RepID=A0ABV9DB54_9MICO|nr:saccharopine dehydrogenase NADP-binding domain-containing protein [Georgenia faecalis]